jgi:GT2 family glycosyltransferase
LGQLEEQCILLKKNDIFRHKLIFFDKIKWELEVGVKNMNLSVIILNYNTKDLTLSCIDSIYKEHKQEIDEKEVEIVLVDNASTDNSVASFKKLGSKIKLIESAENLGFAKGCNLGAGMSSGEYLLFLNSDTEVKDKGFLKMAEYLKGNPKVGILGGKLRNIDGSIQKSCGKFYNLFNLALMLLGFERLGFLRFSPKTSRKVDWVSGASLMVKKDIFKQIGKFENELFMYMEDQELCFRAKLRGLETHFYKEVEVVHKERGSSNKTFAIVNIYKGIKFFYKKHKPKWQYPIAVFMLKAKALILVVLAKIINNKYLKSTYREALRV